MAQSRALFNKHEAFSLIPSTTKTKKKIAGGMAQVAEYLLSKWSNPTTVKEKKKKS
jgi:hypothetical protein